MSLINTCHLLLTNLHRCLEEAVKGVYGFVPMPAAGTLADRAVSLKATFDANPSAFVTTLAHLTTLNSLLAEYRQQAFPANTTTITVEATRLIAWNDVINKPVKFPPTAHTHTAQPIAWDAVQNKPTTFPPDVHAHDYASITNKPATFPPDVHAHDYASITNKPATFPPDVHAHDYASITDKPTTFEPSSHAHVYADITDAPTSLPMAAHSHAYADITSKPTTFAPAAHSHAYADITSKPTTFAPAAHSHAYADITSKPTTFAPSAHSHVVTTSMYYIGNGEGSRVLSLPIAIIPQIILICPLNGGVTWYWAISLVSTLGGKSTFIDNAISVASGSVSLTTSNANTTGVGYTLIVWGNAS